jgi:hypothetical protein
MCKDRKKYPESQGIAEGITEGRAAVGKFIALGQHV